MVKKFINNPPRWVRHVPLLHILRDRQEENKRKEWLDTANFFDLEEEYLFMTGKLPTTSNEDDLRVLVKRQDALQRGTLKKV